MVPRNPQKRLHELGGLGGAECGGDHVCRSSQGVPCPSQGRFPSFWEPARPCPLGHPRAGQAGAAAVVQGVSSPAVPALACTGLPAAVNHCSNTPAGERAAEEGQAPPPPRPALSKARATPQDPTSYSGAETTSPSSFVGTRQTSSIPSKSVPLSVSSLRVNSEKFSGRARRAAQSQEALVQTTALPLTSCVTLAKNHSLSVLQFPGL